jgi:hypothetical protein
MAANPGSAGSGPSTPQALLAFRIIGASMGLGVTLFAFVSWFLHLQSSPTPPAIDLDLAFNVWMVVAVLAIAGALLFWRTRVAPLLDGQATPVERTARAGETQTRVVITWALLEAPALLAVVIYFLYDYPLAGLLGVVLIWVGLALTWPQREWFGA